MPEWLDANCGETRLGFTVDPLFELQFDPLFLLLNKRLKFFPAKKHTYPSKNKQWRQSHITLTHYHTKLSIYSPKIIFSHVLCSIRTPNHISDSLFTGIQT